MFLEIPGMNAVWRVEHIAAIEQVDDTVSIIPIYGFTAEERRDYEYPNEKEARAAYAICVANWRKAVTGSPERPGHD